MAQFTDYGKRVKKALIDRAENQSWLIAEIRERTGMYVDNGYLYKVLTGERDAPKIKTAINEILGITEGGECLTNDRTES